MHRIGRWVRKYLAEILMIGALLGMVGCVAFVAVMQNYSGALRFTTRLKLKVVEDALRRYGVDNDLPSQTEGLGVLTEPRRGEAPYLDESLKDAWNRDIQYFNPARTGKSPFELVSAGADGELGTEDDILPRKKRF